MTKIEIIPVFCNEQNMANYAYIIHKKDSQNAIIIDAAEANPIINKLKELNLTPTHILTTHHHFDHVGGNLILKEKFNTKIIAPELEFSLVPGADIPAKEGILIKIDDIEFNIILASGHTNGHVLYYLKDGGFLFTGDVLFNLCVGGLFEGTSEQMFQSLQKIKSLPEETLIFPGHEYTRSCITPDMASTKGFDNYLQKMFLREQGELAPVTLKEEKLYNPYLQATTLTQFLG